MIELTNIYKRKVTINISNVAYILDATNGGTLIFFVNSADSLHVTESYDYVSKSICDNKITK